MNKKFIAVCTAISLMFVSASVAFADPLTDKLNSQKQQMQKDKEQLDSVKMQREKLEADIEKLDNQIEKFNTDLQNTKIQITKTGEDIKIAQVQLNKSIEDIKEGQDLFNKRVRAMYINGTGSYVNFILESKGVSDFLSKMDTIKKIMDFDNKVIAELNVKMKDVQHKKNALDNQNAKLIVLKSDNEKRLVSLNDAKVAQGKAIKEAQSQEKLLASKVNESTALINSTTKQIEEIRNAAPKYNPSRGAAQFSTNNVISYASNFLGIQYQWGGNGPNTFDCSGFTSYVYSHFGISLPRVSEDQQNFGMSVSKDNLKPGDLVFFGYPAHHVGIYVGNGCYIHAPRTGDVIKISPLDRSDFTNAKRVQ